MSAVKNLTGEKFTRLLVVERSGSTEVDGRAMWKCICDCGKTVTVRGKDLRNGKTLSCGCYHSDRVKNSFGSASLHRLYYSYKERAKRKGLIFEFTEEEFSRIIQEKCFYCGEEPSNNYFGAKGANGGVIYNGIDRIDNTKGYIKENSVTCCQKCNYAKRKMGQEDFYSWVNRIYNNLHEKGKL